MLAAAGRARVAPPGVDADVRRGHVDAWLEIGTACGRFESDDERALRAGSASSGGSRTGTAGRPGWRPRSSPAT